MSSSRGVPGPFGRESGGDVPREEQQLEFEIRLLEQQLGTQAPRWRLKARISQMNDVGHIKLHNNSNNISIAA